MATSVPFVVLGLGGLKRLRMSRGRMSSSEMPLVALVLSFILVGAGSIFYHWAPSSQHLLWDRVPIAICLAASTCAMVNLHADSRVGSALLAPAVIVAVASVVYWYFTWSRGHEDLRPYAIVQICAMVIAALVAFRRPLRNAGIADLRWALAAYAAGRVLELFQQQIYDRFGADFGHPLKHVLVAIAGFLVLRGLVSAMNQQSTASSLQFDAASPD